MWTKAIVFVCLSWLVAAAASAQEPTPGAWSFIRESCIRCHGADTTTNLNLDTLGFDLNNPSTFKAWVAVHDRVSKGEMPPPSEPRPDALQMETALAALREDLRSTNLNARQQHGRVPARRLTRTEYNYSVKDLLSIEGEFGALIPEESTAGSFDTVGSAQHFSAMHLEGYLAAADKVLDAAIRLYRNPYVSHEFDLLNSKHLNSFHDRELRIGGNISRRLNDGVAIFRDVDYLLRSDLHGFKVRRSASGFYRIKIIAEAFQSEDPVTMKVVVKDVNGQSELIAAYDLISGESHSLEVKAWLTRSKVFYIAMAEERSPARILADIYDAGGAKNYKGKGIHIKAVQVDGPLSDGWPPESTRRLLADCDLSLQENGTWKAEISEPPRQVIERIVKRVARLAFRRPLADGEVDTFVNLAEPALADGQDFTEVVRIPLRAILTAPQFLLFTGPSGRLDDFALASRLSYFLWKSQPDRTLLEIAERGELDDSEVLAQQVERMLNEDRSQRFVRDFFDQWLRLNEIEATTPDEKLYPEYDELLHWSIPRETQAFLSDLIERNLSVSHLIDSDFAFLNRRLARHYGVDGVVGQNIRRVKLPNDSPRGGVLTQASVLKVTANGLVTSPVKRGAFVLSDLLGTPLPPPPANVGSIEPDTSGATTIRDALRRHRDVEECSRCHSKIDPPGFALESFDPIGGYRTHYRKRFDDISSIVKYETGPKVDSSGVTCDGTSFDGVQAYKSHLMKHKEQLARHFISQLLIYSTGGEIQFADREEIERIVRRVQPQDFPIRTIIHEVVLSELFRNR